MTAAPAEAPPGARRAPSWYARRRRPRVQDSVGLPSAWRYGGPTSDNATSSTSLTRVEAPTSVTAAARVVKPEDKEKDKRSGGDEAATDSEVWSLYDQVGELHYVSNAIAARMGQAELYLEKDGARLDKPDAEEQAVLDLLTPQIVERSGLNVFVAGGFWLVGIPKTAKAKDEGGERVEAADTGKREAEWLVASNLEMRRTQGKVTIRGKEYVETEIFTSRIWDPHPADWDRCDSPALAALPVLRELVGLTQHTSAQIDSRLAGAGVYWIPTEILNNPKVPEGTPGGTFSDNPVLNAIMTAMLLPMEDRSNASSVVPLLLGAPGDHISKIRFDSFATPFDENTPVLREGAVRRLGTILDAPPELLLGMGDANHWGMWLVRDEVVQAHVAPRLALLCDGYTTAFFRPVMEQLGRADADAYEVKADVSGLVQRPNRLADASQLHSVGAISDKALREAGGFEETDAPSSNEVAVAKALEIASANPQLLDNMPEIVVAIQALLDGTPATGPAPVLDPPTTANGRQPGTLRPGAAAPLEPAATAGKEAPLAEADAAPQAGAPV